MKLRIIKSEAEYDRYLEWVDEMFDSNPPIDSPEGEELQVALLLIKQYLRVVAYHSPSKTRCLDCKKRSVH